MRDLATLPKTNLHVHLESALRHPVIPVEGFADFFVQRKILVDTLRTGADFRRAAVEFCADEAAQGTRYAEVSFSAAAHAERLGDPDVPLRAVLDGLAEGHETYGLESRLILDHSRRRPVERAWLTLRLAERYEQVAAIGLAGDESHPGDPFEEVFETARREGVHVVHHAGEAAGPASVRQAMRTAERLGHGIRVLDDDDLVAEIRARRLPLEVCPASNVALGLVPSYAEHPLPRLRDAGLIVTVNTDVPAMTGITLTGEYERLRTEFGFGDEILAELARNGVAASFAPAATKDRLLQEIDSWLVS
jgi:adenosine deaminase